VSDQALVEFPLADRRDETDTLADDAADRTDLLRNGMIGHLRVRAGEVLAIHGNAPVNAAPDIAEDALAIDILRRADAATAADAAVGVERDIGMRGIERPAGLQIGKLGGLGHVQPVGHRLKLAIAARLADRAKVIAFVEEHFHQIPAHLIEPRGLVFDGLAGCRRLGAGRNAPPPRLDGADPAAALMAQALVVAQARNIDARLIGGFHDRHAGIGLHLDPVDGEGEAGFSLRTAHWEKSLSKM